MPANCYNILYRKINGVAIFCYACVGILLVVHLFANFAPQVLTTTMQSTKITLSQLDSFQLKAADILRGSTDASESKEDTLYFNLSSTTW
jgi:hypothetical protein